MADRRSANVILSDKLNQCHRLSSSVSGLSKEFSFHYEKGDFTSVKPQEK